MFPECMAGVVTFMHEMINDEDGKLLLVLESMATTELPYCSLWWLIVTIFVFVSLFIIGIARLRERNYKVRLDQTAEIERLRALSYQYQLEIEQVNNFFAQSMYEQKNCDDVLWDVVQNCISQLGFEDCVIYLIGEDSNELIQKAALGAKSTARYHISNPIRIPVGKGIVGHVAVTGKAEIVDDTTLDARYIVDDNPRLSEIAVPMIDNGRVIGVIDSEHSQKGFYSQRHLQILITIASQCVSRINKVKSEEAIRKKEIELISLHRDLALSRLSALRSQMNPHFIFNSLNSIQYYIALNDKHAAMQYLSKFSRLMRQTLDSSCSECIRLSDELEILDGYVALEQMRLDNMFDYVLHVDPEIDIETLDVPPMLVQPHVENAILHGLRHLTSRRGKLVIKIVKRTNGIRFIIEDNGIGRVKSAQLRSATHRSVATQIGQRRVAGLNTSHECPFIRCSTTDLYDEDQNACGTCVEVEISEHIAKDAYIAERAS